MGDVSQHLHAEPGQAGLDRGVAADQVGVLGGDAEGGGAADVLPRQVHGAGLQVADEPSEVGGRGHAVVVVRGDGGVPEASQVDGEDSVPPAQQGDDLAEHPPGLREAVHEQHGGARGSRGDVVQVGAVDLRLVMLQASQWRCSRYGTLLS